MIYKRTGFEERLFGGMDKEQLVHGREGMFTLSDFRAVTKQQLRHDRNKNLFYMLASESAILSPSKESVEVLKQKAKDIGDCIQTAELDGTFMQIVKDVSNETMRLFMEVNQYLDFSREDYRQLQNTYSHFFDQVKVMGEQEDISDKEIGDLFRSHYKRLQAFLLDSNGKEIFRKYRDNPDLLAIKCAEYTPRFQIGLLGIDLSAIKQPLLDIGCGHQASLVNFLRESGIESYGVDRDVDTTDYLHEANWLEYTFTPDTWGTVISHMAFSNHFIHHNLRADGDFEIYAKKYMEILKSLKLGGRFIYAPSLSFMEEILISSTGSYAVKTKKHSTQVTRIG